MNIVGVDFTSAPRHAKPIMVAHGTCEGTLLHIERVVEHVDWLSYEAWLVQSESWVGGFDLPFGLARELVEHLGWPQTWTELVTHCAALERAELRNIFKAFCNARPAGSKFAYRVTDSLAGSSPSMKWVNPPVAYMFHEGTRRLLQAGVFVFGLHAGDPRRIALEAYPGLVARALTRASYKSDLRAKQTPARRDVRNCILHALENGMHPFGITLKIGKPLRQQLLDDGTADALDAVLCAVAAAWAVQQPRYGLPRRIDPVEGWITGTIHGDTD
jgi:hypothetical protein